MLYIGKFISNFKDFYNEINSATLTGAIDVIIVRQPDGSFVCSPFHVRFGKIGVLRSREKVVDIMVNGVPVDIHMKLGESGEAFFVEEVQDDNEIPAYLATSPLPDVPNIASELEKMKLSVGFNEQIDNKVESKILTVSDTQSTVETTATSQEMVLAVTSSPSDYNSCDISTSDNFPKRVDTSHSCESSKVIQTVPISIDDMSKSKNTVHTDSSDEFKTKRKRRKKVVMKKRTKTKDVPTQPSKLIPINRHIDLPSKEADDASDKSEEIFQMDDDYNDKDEGFASSSCLSRSVSLPVSANFDDLFGSEWNKRKMSSTFVGEFHPFSDGDVTPHSSPIASRPPSPKSDTEYENQKIDTSSPSDVSAPSWGWGQLPNVPRRLSDAHMQNGSAIDSAVSAEESKGENAVEAEKRSMLGGMLSFMRSTKKMRHMPEKEGIYLSELNADELDPELAALYFPKFNKEKCESISYPYSDIAMSLCGGLQDPDTDLPEERFLHSLVTFDEFTENPAILQDPNLVIRIGGKYYNWPTAASMLTSIIMFQRPLPEKTANQLIQEHMPKKKKSKSYSSWWSWRRSETESKTEEDTTLTEITTTSVAGRSEVVCEESVEQRTCDIEISECTVSNEKTLKETVPVVTEIITETHEVSISVDREALEEIVVDDSKTIEEIITVSPPSSESSTSYSSPINITSSTRAKSETSSLSPPETFAQLPHSAKESAVESDKSQKEKYMKSLRLTSEQIANLNLKDGPNEFEFSVTTAYQGTTKCNCHVFLWNYDDKIVISDIDGTITKSDVLGHILPMVGHSWAQLGVAKLFTKIKNNGYKFLYLSARAIGQARITREYLRRLRQGEIFLPDGPLLLSPTSLISALHREVIECKPEEFKISCLKDIQTLFPPVMGNPFYAGFGNKINDTWAYRAVGIPLTRIFTINHRGELKLELIQTFQSSYTSLSDQVDHVFPPLKPSVNVNGHPTTIFSSPEEFSYFTYWREPVPALNEDDMTV
ncbi:phosphatidate phosphatase LPIN3-like isoform X2 [Stegodyphus dumicola]|uniref:phosphatidate phosphatase LPIN3-like isoform X2 n=1 Tax=Stegodyphus dumicola TaxID=202533 RepID=UPI0015B2809A|nr:phosphatidate phosphatase LPIN3-like isoform X2 [Stegodyphus dumicola]